MFVIKIDSPIGAITSIESVKDRAFTEEESAQNHCQIGNVDLTLGTMIEWIEENKYFDY